MKCQQCGVNRANIAMAMQFNNEKMQVHLCNECFQKIQGQFTDPQQGSNMFSHPFFQGNVGGQGQSRTTTHQQNAKRGGGLLDELGTNVTDAARNGKIDTVIGRKKKLKQIIEPLIEKEINNLDIIR